MFTLERIYEITRISSFLVHAVSVFVPPCELLLRMGFSTKAHGGREREEATIMGSADFVDDKLSTVVDDRDTRR